jgi:purine-binding chemotaxis protein CheW
MGRMADARKRARGKSGGGDSLPPEPETPATTDAFAAPPPDVPLDEPSEVSAPPRPAPRAEPNWVSRAENLTFPEDPQAELSSQRLALPSSGLAEDILVRPEAATVAPSFDRAPEPLAPLTAPDATSRAQSISFFATPAREERKAVEVTEHLATFFLGVEEYGVDVKLVQEIIRVTEVTPVPRAPEFIRGVINLRGRIIPVVDLKRKLALGDVETARNSRIVVVKLKERLVGLLVDGASQVLKVPLSTIEPPPDEVVESGGSYIRGVAKLDKRLIILVDLMKILAPELREGQAAEATE